MADDPSEAAGSLSTPRLGAHQVIELDDLRGLNLVEQLSESSEGNLSPATRKLVDSLAQGSVENLEATLDAEMARNEATAEGKKSPSTAHGVTANIEEFLQVGQNLQVLSSSSSSQAQQVGRCCLCFHSPEARVAVQSTSHATPQVSKLAGKGIADTGQVVYYLPTGTTNPQQQVLFYLPGQSNQFRTLPMGLPPQPVQKKASQGNGDSKSNNIFIGICSERPRKQRSISNEYSDVEILAHCPGLQQTHRVFQRRTAAGECGSACLLPFLRLVFISADGKCLRAQVTTAGAEGVDRNYILASYCFILVPFVVLLSSRMNMSS
eukprot:755192-Hanusia_phi.AAC.1